MADEKPNPENGQVAIRDNNMLDILRTATEKLGGEGTESIVAAIKELAELKIRLDKIDAEKEFNKALAEFQAECPAIKKSSTAQIATKGGSKFSYRYAELDEIARTVKPHLFHRGLSFTWGSDTADGVIKTTCYLRHKNGHSIQASFQAPIPNELGSMNEIQRHASVLTYVKRQALVEVLGLTATENDTDGVSPEKIDDKQLKILRSAIKSSGVDESKLCKYLEIDKIEDLRKADFATAAMAVREKEKQAPKTDVAPPAELKRARLKMQIKDIQERMEKLNIGQEYIDKQKKIIDGSMTFEQAEKLSITLDDIQGQEV